MADQQPAPPPPSSDSPAEGVKEVPPADSPAEEVQAPPEPEEAAEPSPRRISKSVKAHLGMKVPKKDPERAASQFAAALIESNTAWDQVAAELEIKLPKHPVEKAHAMTAVLLEVLQERDRATEKLVARLENELPKHPAKLVRSLIGEVDRWIRAAAEYDNIRKRSEEEIRARAVRERQEILEQASERVLIFLLPILDALDASLAVDPNLQTSQSMRQGMEGIRHMLLSDVLSKEGLTPVEATPGMPFDPTVHEAVKMAGEKDQAPEGSGEVVSAEVRRGYRFQTGKVLRPAQVEVGYALPPQEEAASDDPPQQETTADEAAPVADAPPPAPEAEDSPPEPPVPQDTGEGPGAPPGDTSLEERDESAESSPDPQPESQDVEGEPVASPDDSQPEKGEKPDAPV